MHQLRFSCSKSFSPEEPLQSSSPSPIGRISPAQRCCGRRDREFRERRKKRESSVSLCFLFHRATDNVTFTAAQLSLRRRSMKKSCPLMNTASYCPTPSRQREARPWFRTSSSKMTEEKPPPVVRSSPGRILRQKGQNPQPKCYQIVESAIGVGRWDPIPDSIAEVHHCKGADAYLLRPPC